MTRELCEMFLKQLTLMCCTILQNHFIYQDDLGLDMTKPCISVNCPEPTQIDYPHCCPYERIMILTFHIFIF